MELNHTPTGERLHIGFFGCRNVGKSSLVNEITNQDMSIVSNIKGTTTDPVTKSMELLPIGPVVIIDTPGFDDEGSLGEQRINQAKRILRSCDIAILVTDATTALNQVEKHLISEFIKRKIPYIIAKNKIDLLKTDPVNDKNIIYISTIQKKGIDNLKNAISNLVEDSSKKVRYIADFIKPKDIVILVTPIDSSAPKGRMIMPQQLAIRDIIDSHAIPVITRESELKDTLLSLKKNPSLVVTDSQVFELVNKVIPKDIPLTSFSILMARYKGFLETAINGVKAIKNLKNSSRILISEGCTHHRQCEDIGTVKLPKLLKNFTGLDLQFEWTNGLTFPNDLTRFDLIIHCGACMLNSNEMNFRMTSSVNQEIPFTNYGIAIAYMKGILDRSIKFLY